MALDRTKPRLEPRPNIATTLAAAAAAAMPEPPANDQSPAEMKPNPNDDTIEFDELSGPSIQKASRIPEGAFNQRVVIQVQAVQNFIVASTPYDTYADALSDVTSLQLEDATYEISPSRGIDPQPGPSGSGSAARESATEGGAAGSNECAVQLTLVPGGLTAVPAGDREAAAAGGSESPAGEGVHRKG
ncbi:hypothetical protein HPB47_001395 [Ixodes persulcatus]|uniref:Uncharacterized protein n=1 Tax=Ixodes persulcatus TaxID=34615 RepID=A0AC60PP91_IXOPE|nr:hypothetical protein HPB47_001395 [Ixodes persulcatus]